MKLAIIGGGNMGGSIAAGAVAKKVVSIDQIIISHPKRELSDMLAGLRSTRDNVQAIEGADLIVIAVKPWLMEQVAKELAPHVDPQKQCIVSIAAGIPFSSLEEWFGSAGLFRVIPNTAISLGCSVTFIARHGASEAQREAVVRLFSALGQVFEIDEQQMQAGTALASCGIAYALRYLDAAAHGGKRLGIDYPTSLQIVINTMKGALALLDANQSTPQQEIDKVTTPGGITLRGLEAMEGNGFSGAVTAGLEASK